MAIYAACPPTCHPVICGKDMLLFSSAKREYDDSYSLPAAPSLRLRGTKQEAIHAGTLDCFPAFAMTEGLTAIVIIKDCEVRSEAIHTRVCRIALQMAFMQSARRPVIANAGKQSMQVQ
jgi:hypothetical protein